MAIAVLHFIVKNKAGHKRDSVVFIIYLALQLLTRSNRLPFCIERAALKHRYT